MIPDGEKVVGDYLRGHAEITALDAEVVGRTPSNTDDFPWVRVTQLDGTSNMHPEHLVEFYFQLDCYASEDGSGGSQQKEVSLLARSVRAALATIHTASHSGAVVSGAAISGDARIPDDDFEPARERRVLTASVWAHAV